MSSLALKWHPPLLALATSVAIGVLEPKAGLPTVQTVMSWLTVAFFCVAGLALSLSALWSLRRARTSGALSGAGTRSALVTDGVYGISRNPMWLGLTLFLLGWVKFLALPFLLVGPLLFWLVMHFVYVRLEERALAGEFGQAYASYKATVRRWV